MQHYCFVFPENVLKIDENNCFSLSFPETTSADASNINKKDTFQRWKMQVIFSTVPPQAPN